ncbi:hypothetical protein ACWD6K_31350 [Streptomyces sp. NPDC002431]
MSKNGYDGISLAGRWECGACGASGDGWWDENNGLVLDAEHECEESAR